VAAVNSRSVDIKQLPLEQLASIVLQRLRDYKTLERANKSALYREKWRAAGISVEEIETYEDFTKIPFITGRDLRNAINDAPIEEVLCSDLVLHWFSTTGSTGMPKWMPYGRRDLDLFMEIRDRDYSMTPYKNGLAVVAPAPSVENGLAGLNMIRRMITQTQVGGVDCSLTEVDREESVEFGLSIKPDAIAAYPSFAARLAEIIEERAPGVARQAFSEKRYLRNLAVFMFTRMKKIRPKDLSRFRWGLFGGEPLDPYRRVLEKVYGLEAYEMYVFTEFMYPSIECHLHDGMHLWMDICLPEIIPEPELDKEREDDGYSPQAVPLWKAKQGIRGEYVLTTFGEALPLVRYRVGDLIEVVSTKPCPCGITHPRIKVPRRSDDTICLGPIRFPASQLDKILLGKTPHGQALRWQLRITREEYRPKPVILLEPCERIADSESFLRETSNRLHELNILRIGIENRIVAEPIVLLEERISDEGQHVTKAGRVIYEGENR
jgi:phenylacetate-CoA ligase